MNYTVHRHKTVWIDSSSVSLISGSESIQSGFNRYDMDTGVLTIYRTTMSIHSGFEIGEGRAESA